MRSRRTSIPVAGNPRKGTIQRQVSELLARIGIQSVRLESEKSPAMTFKPRKHSRV
jgi:hypothetical protein